jgi:hypothetical protein
MAGYRKAAAAHQELLPPFLETFNKAALSLMSLCFH